MHRAVWTAGLDGPRAWRARHHTSEFIRQHARQAVGATVGLWVLLGIHTVLHGLIGVTRWAADRAERELAVMSPGWAFGLLDVVSEINLWVIPVELLVLCGLAERQRRRAGRGLPADYFFL